MYRVGLNYYGIEHFPEAAKVGVSVRWLQHGVSKTERIEAADHRWVETADEAREVAMTGIARSLRGTARKITAMVRMFGDVEALRSLPPEELALLRAAIALEESKTSPTPPAPRSG